MEQRNLAVPALTLGPRSEFDGATDASEPIEQSTGAINTLTGLPHARSPPSTTDEPTSGH